MSPCVLFGGQSLVLTPTSTPVTLVDPIYPGNQSYRIEFQIHNWTLPPTGGQPAIFALNGLGASAWLWYDGRVALGSLTDSVVEQQPCLVNTNGLTNVLIRFQKDVPNMRYTCEIWSYDGTGYGSDADTIRTLGNPTYSGGVIGGGVTASLGFLRVFTTVVPVGGKPPTTADAGDYTELKFDGDLTDSSGNGHGGTLAQPIGNSSSQSLSPFTATANQVPVAFPKTFGAPFWTNWASLRAGFPAKLDGSASYTLADRSSSVSYSWKQLSGPSTVIWQDSNTATPTITGLIFGSYQFQLQVTDGAGGTAVASLETGAVATDANGVVVNANPAADAIFGPMIAFGRNPWGWADERNLAMENLQKDTYAKPPSWSGPAESQTVSYTFYGVTPASTSISADITADTLTIPVVNAASLDLSTFPTQILIGSIFGPEVIRICSASGNTLTACYDGRGFHAGHYWDKAPTAWPNETGVWQTTVTGAGTHFLTTMCRFGPGYTVAGNLAVTSAGSVTVTPGSTSVTGIGTAWDGTQNSLAIAVNATHAGIPFTFFASVVSARGTSLTLSRPFPADADGGAYTYQIFSDQRNVVLHYTRSDSTDSYIYFSTSGCESDTTLFLDGGWDNGHTGQVVSASPYTYMDGAGYAGDFSPNYYDLGLAHYAFYFRSGMQQSLKSARDIEDFWIHYPDIAEGEAGGAPRSRSLLGVFAAAVLDDDRGSNWPGLRTFAQSGVNVANASNCDDDPRETAYELSWLALAAQFDPDPAQRANWQASMAAAYARDNACKGSDNSYPSGFYWNPASFPNVAVTNGSQNATSATATFPSNACYGVAAGTAIAVNGSAVLTVLSGSFVPPAGTNSIVVGGTKGGVRYDLSTQFDYVSAGSLNLAAFWLGDSGTVYWMISNNDQNPAVSVATIATGPSDSDNFGQIFGCMLTDSSHMVLHRPWPGASGTYGFFSYNLVGKGTQPFMMGIKALQMRYAGQVYDSYRDLDVGVSNWIAQVGFDQAAKGISYGRGFPQCEPLITDSGIKDVEFRNAGCMENANNPAAVSQARARNSEAQNAMTVMYLANSNDQNRAIGDMFYGATYGAKGYTASGYWTDGITASNLEDFNLSGYKWPGFFFGVGMAHQWPAARVGGVAPPSNRSVSIDFDPTLSASVQIVVTAPSGAVSTYPCGSSSPCSVTVDDRQGSHWAQTQYLSVNGKVLSQSDPVLLQSMSPAPKVPIFIF
jgi:hypothetical protein